MDTVVLKCGTDTVLHACDANWTNSLGSCTLDTSIKHDGTGSVKIVLGTTSGLQAYKSFTSADISTMLAVQVCLRISSGAATGSLKLLLCSDTSGATAVETLVIPALVSGWNICTLPLAVPANCTAIQSVAIQYDTASASRDLWVDNVLAVNARSYQTYGVRGFDDVDSLRFWPGVQNTCPSGELRVRSTAFGRIISFKITPHTTKAERVWLVTSFALATVRKMIYSNEDVAIVFQDAQTPFGSEWLHNTPIGRAYPMTLVEQSVRSTAPDAWA